MMQFYPIEGAYVYFRYDKNQTILCALNTLTKPVTIDLTRFKEIIQNHKSGKEVVTNRIITLDQSMTLNPMSNLVLELQ